MPLIEGLGELGGLVEADARLAVIVARANAPPASRIEILSRMALGETAPRGPAADPARAEAFKLA